MGVEHTFDDAIRQLRQAGQQITGPVARVLLQRFGIQLLSWAKQDYISRSRGGQDPAGNKWQPIKGATKDARTRRMASFKRLKGKDSRDRALAAARPSARIGIDRGILLASLTFRDPNSILQVERDSVTVGSKVIDPKTGVGYGPFFDKDRDIIFDNMVTAGRQTILDGITTRAIESELGKGDAFNVVPA